MNKRMDSETDIRLGKAADETVVVYRMFPSIALTLADLLLEAAPGDSGFETDARNLKRLVNRLVAKTERTA